MLCEPGEVGVRELKVVEGGEESSDLPGPDGIWYQTQTVDPQEAASETDQWVPALTEEYIGLANQCRAITPIKKSDVLQEDIDSGAVEVLPAKVVYTRNHPTDNGGHA